MASTAELSLDDIIRKKRPISQRGRGGIRRGGVVRPQFKQNTNPANKNGQNFNSKRGGFVSRGAKQPILGDARNRIILKNRTKIADARDKLAEMAKHRDARDKLQQLRMNRGVALHLNVGPNVIRNIRNGLKPRGRPNRGGFTDLTRQVHSSPLLLPHVMSSRNVQMSPGLSMSDYSPDVSMDEEYVPAPLKPIIRSINNDLPHYLPPPPDFPTINRVRNPKPLKDKTILGDRQSSFNLTIVAKNNDLRKPTPNSAGILKRIHRSEERIHSREHSPPSSPVSILKKRPSASLRSRLEAPMHSSSPSEITVTRRPAAYRPQSPVKAPGYRIVVSNLQNSVTAADIKELFGDIGVLLESRLVRPGTAEVIYSSLKDAQKAVDAYHNRQLDGHPMNCFLVNPRTPAPTTRHGTTTSKNSSIRSTNPSLPASSNSSVTPDVSTFYKVLFGKDQN